MEKNLIIGAFTGYNFNQLKPWVKSICEKMPTAKKVMVVGDCSDETKTKLVEHGFELLLMGNPGNIPIHVARFLYIYEYLKEHWQEFKYVVTTDVKDVYFQKDPFEYLETYLGKRGLIAGSESMLYKDEPWGNENLHQCYGPYIHNIFKENEIYNVGTVGGKSEYVKDIVFNIFTNAVNRPIPIVDQAVYNVLIQTQPYKDATFFAKQSDGWACQAGTTVDPSRIEQFRPFLTEKEPTFSDGLVYTSTGEVFCIVHQYDRVPEWKKFVQKRYEQHSDEEYFVYKV